MIWVTVTNNMSKMLLSCTIMKNWTGTGQLMKIQKLRTLDWTQQFYKAHIWPQSFQKDVLPTRLMAESSYEDRICQHLCNQVHPMVERERPQMPARSSCSIHWKKLLKKNQETILKEWETDSPIKTMIMNIVPSKWVQVLKNLQL